MASSGSKTVTVTSWDTLKFSWWFNSGDQSTANNTTIVRWKLELISGSSGRIDSTTSKAWSVTVNGTSYSGTNTIGIANNSTKTLASGSTVVTHADDGTKTFHYSFSQTFGITFSGSSIGTISGSGSGTLDTIARASQPSCITWPEHTQNVGEFGDTISIHMNRKSSDFTHTVRYQFGSQSGTIATGVGTGTTWVIPLTLMNLIPNSTSGSGTIYVDTYNGSTLVGTKWCGFTATVPSSVIPSLSVTLEDTTGIDDIYGSPVKSLSKIKITPTVTLAYSSPVASYVITSNGVTYNTSTATTGFLTTSGDSPVTVTVKDKRGRSATWTYTMTVLDYSSPAISILTVRRCDSDGTENDQGDYGLITFSANVSGMDDVNTATYTVRYKKTADTEWTEVVLSDMANIYTASNQTHVIAADSNDSYDVELIITDRHNTTSRSTSLSTAFTLMNWHASGTGMGIGKVCETENTLEIALDVKFLGNLTGTIFDAILPVGSMVLRYDHIDPSTIYPGTTWERVYGAFPWFTDANGQIGTTGGERTVTLTVDQIPAHNHGGTYTNAGTSRTHAWLASGGSAMGYDSVDVGGGEAHNNMPPYIQISAWRRTA